MGFKAHLQPASLVLNTAALQNDLGFAPSNQTIPLHASNHLAIPQFTQQSQNRDGFFGSGAFWRGVGDGWGPPLWLKCVPYIGMKAHPLSPPQKNPQIPSNCKEFGTPAPVALSKRTRRGFIPPHHPQGSYRGLPHLISSSGLGDILGSSSTPDEALISELIGTRELHRQSQFPTHSLAGGEGQRKTGMKGWRMGGKD